ncbi:hypothetical protein BJX62DRAFT_13040 [Aspergillus germanicus]
MSRWPKCDISIVAIAISTPCSDYECLTSLGWPGQRVVPCLVINTARYPIPLLKFLPCPHHPASRCISVNIAVSIHSSHIMLLSTEAIIALVTLVSTGPPSALLAWSYYSRRRRRASTAASSMTPRKSSVAGNISVKKHRLANTNPASELAPPHTESSISRIFSWSSPPQEPDLLLEAGVYTRRTRTDVVSGLFLLRSDAHLQLLTGKD